MKLKNTFLSRLQMTVPYYPEQPNDLRRRERDAVVHARDAHSNGVSRGDDDVAREGEYLVSNFIEGELLSRDLFSRPIQRTPPFCPRTPWLHDQDDLLAIARDFSSSAARTDVRRVAESVQIETLTAAGFRSLCDDLFAPPAGITRERIVVLFFFMADLAALAVAQRLHAVHANVMNWSVEYVRERICVWVQENGGWVSYLSSWLLVRVFKLCSVFDSWTIDVTMNKNS